MNRGKKGKAQAVQSGGNRATRVVQGKKERKKRGGKGKAREDTDKEGEACPSRPHGGSMWPEREEGKKEGRESY